MDEAKLLSAIQKAKRTLVDYRHIMLVNGEGELEPAPYHYDWSDMLLNGKGNEAVEAYRESGKTQLVLRAFLLYCLQFPSNERDYIVLIKKNSRLAGAKLKEIQDEYKTNPAVSANCVKIKEDSADVFSVDVKDSEGRIQNIRIEAYGKGASIRGLANIDRRPKIVIIDDPQDIEDAISPTVQANDWNWYLSDVMFLGQKTRVFLIGNNLGESCIIERVAADPVSLGFTFTRIPCVQGDDPTWGAKYTLPEIRKERDNFRKLGKIDIWLREKMCIAIADETRIFIKDDFRYFDGRTIERRLGEYNRYLLVDPAASIVESSDYRGLVVVYADAENQWFIPECSYGTYDSMKTIDEMFRLVVEWEIRDVGIEQGIYKSAIEPFLLKEMKRRNQFFNVIPLKHGGKRKEDRIRVLQPRFKAHSIFFAEGGWWLPELESELLAFTMMGSKGLHDDLIDALAYAEQVVTTPYRPNKRNRNLPRTSDSETDLLSSRR